MPKNVAIEVHLKNSEVSQTPSNYTVLKMSERVAAGRSWEIILSSSVKWSSCLVSFFWAALWNMRSSHLKVMWRIRESVFRRKAWLCPFASICKRMDRKRWKMLCTSVSASLQAPALCWRGKRDSEALGQDLCTAVRLDFMHWSLILASTDRQGSLDVEDVPILLLKVWCHYQSHDAAYNTDNFLYGMRCSECTRTALVFPLPKFCSAFSSELTIFSVCLYSKYSEHDIWEQ